MKEDMYRSQFRLPYPLYEDLKKAADQNHRSLNAEIVARLQESFGKPLAGDDTDEGTALRMARERYAEAQAAMENAIEAYQRAIEKMEIERRNQ